MTTILELTDFTAPELDVYARLSEVQLLRLREPEPGIFLAESEKVIRRALDAGYTPVSLLVEKALLQREGVRQLMADCGSIPIYAAEKSVLSQLVGYHLTNGILCAMNRKALPALADICAGASRIAILENVVNPTNVGAIFRSAAALHMDAVLLTADCTDPLYRRAIRVSMGTVFQIPWTILPKSQAWPEDGMKELRRLGFQTVAMALKEDSLSIDNPRLRQAEKLAILLGAEGEGLSEDTIASCDFTVRIPMSHGVDSLNVAAASAVTFWELGKHE